MALSSFELRKAVYARLDAQLATPIYSYVPQNSAYPYIRIGDISMVTDDTKTTQMQLYTVMVHSFDKSTASSAAIESVMTNVYAALHNHIASITGYTMVYCRQMRAEVFQQGEPNDRYWHGVQWFDIMVESA